MSSLRHFYIPPDQIQNNIAYISGKEFHHLTNVLRLGVGDEIVILDGIGGIYRAVLDSVDRKKAACRILKYEKSKKPSISVNLFVGLPKSDKMDMIVQKATEIGADSITPMKCKYSVPDLSPQRELKRLERWKTISIEAAKQSHRPHFPSIFGLVSLHDSIKKSSENLKIILVARIPENGNVFKLKDILKTNPDFQGSNIFIGPEGGFSDEEIDLSISAGAIPATLGKNIMRTETAAIAALSIILYELGC
ncbi:RsmE family RNA methyltransferase [Candidatus Poribacteria bacterium]|nr:RsmE family RNA methyltransferase [Candidatus Poribacteria bacterium]